MDDAGGFSQFVRDRSPDLLRTAWLLCGDWYASQDLVQSSLIKTWSSWQRIHGDSPYAYARKILLRDFLRWNRRRRRTDVFVDAGSEQSARYGGGVDIDVRISVLAILRRLPRQQRAVVVLRYYQDLTEAETAALLGCSIGTVKSHTSRALDRLRTIPALNSIRERTGQ